MRRRPEWPGRHPDRPLRIMTIRRSHPFGFGTPGAASQSPGDKDEHCNSTGNGVLKKLILATPLLMSLHLSPAFAARDTGPVPSHPAAAPDAARGAQVGVASWYGRSHAGRLTANGERFNPRAMTCAHRTLRLGSVVAVTNIDTGATVTCRVNDRGPYIRGRILDLSEQAAMRLGVGDRGLMRVRVERVGDGVAAGPG
jgi:rare lipoprotein A